jgi:phospholipid/cholesterol/gamma-HCH transport system substrate-binding protein
MERGTASMTDRAMRFRIGIFVLAALLLLAMLITIFGSFPSLFKRHTSYIVTFQDAPGIAPGTPVRRSGVRIGEVSRIELNDEVRVHILIESPHRIRHMDQPTLVVGILGGDTSIDFIPRQEGEAADRSFVEPDEVLVGARMANINTLLTQASQVVPTTQEALDQMRKSIQRFERLTPQMEEALKEYTRLAQSINKTIPDIQRTNAEIETSVRTWGRLGENVNNLVVTQQDKLIKTLDNLNDTIQRIASVFNDENQRNINVIIRNVRTSSDNLDDLVKNTNDVLKETQKTVKIIGESVSKADEALQNLNKATRPFADRGETISRSLDETTDRLNRVLGDVQSLLRVVGEKDGTFNRLISDPSLYNNIDAAACQLGRMMTRVDRILKDMEVFADKLARHPELIGAGGIVRPSSGLKDAPSNISMVPHLPGH